MYCKLVAHLLQLSRILLYLQFIYVSDAIYEFELVFLGFTFSHIDVLENHFSISRILSSCSFRSAKKGGFFLVYYCFCCNMIQIIMEPTRTDMCTMDQNLEKSAI